MRLILASTSPRRRELLSLLHVPFDVMAPVFHEEIRPTKGAAEQARTFAEGKARSCLPGVASGLIIGCDTLIGLDGDVLGKPADPADATRTLSRLSGRQHTVQTGLAVLHAESGACRSGVEPVHVSFKALTREEIQRYVATGESLGKAGAYGIQGAGSALIEKIEGDFTAAVGLPLKLLAQFLDAFGCHVAIDEVYRTRPYPNWSQFA